MVYAYRQGPVPIISNYDSAWIQDTMTTGQWTFNAGLRYDLQDGKNEAGTVDANIGFPEVMPPLVFPGNDADGVSWKSLSPRLGVTYALGEERKTLVRASLSQFPEALGLTDISSVNPVSGGWAFIVFLDEPGGFTGFYDDGEPWAVLGGWGFDPSDPTALESPNRIDPAMDSAITSEVILGVEHSFRPELVAGLSFTWRLKEDFYDYQPLFTDLDTGATRTASATEYLEDPQPVSGTLPDGSPYSWPTFSANPSLSFTGGELLTNGARSIDYFGTALTLTKRLTNQWMVRGFVNYNFKEEWDVPVSYFQYNDPNRLIWNRDGEAFVMPTSEAFLQSTWQWNLNGMYQVAPDRPWGFNVAANLYGREGYPLPYYRNVAGLDGIRRRIIAVDDLTDFRTESVFTMDLRLEKEFRAAGSTSFTFSIDAFNLFNQGYVLNRYVNLSAGNAEWIQETLSPRIWRLGVRLSWR
jgi:hypothetical protein